MNGSHQIPVILPDRFSAETLPEPQSVEQCDQLLAALVDRMLAIQSQLTFKSRLGPDGMPLDDAGYRNWRQRTVTALTHIQRSHKRLKDWRHAQLCRQKIATVAGDEAPTDRVMLQRAYSLLCSWKDEMDTLLEHELAVLDAIQYQLEGR